MLVCAVTAGQVLVIDPVQGVVSKQLENIPAGVMAVAISPNQQNIIAQTSTNAVILDVETGHPKVVLSGHTRTIDSATFTPDSKWAITGGLDSQVRIWDISRFNTEE